MSAYKLTYLNYRGRAELVRFIFSYAQIEYEDCRLPPEKWAEIRPSKYRWTFIRDMLAHGSATIKTRLVHLIVCVHALHGTGGYAVDVNFINNFVELGYVCCLSTQVPS